MFARPEIIVGNDETVRRLDHISFRRGHWRGLGASWQRRPQARHQREKLVEYQRLSPAGRTHRLLVVTNLRLPRRVMSTGPRNAASTTSPDRLLRSVREKLATGTALRLFRHFS